MVHAPGAGIAGQGWSDSAAMAAAEALDLRMRAGTVVSSAPPADPRTARSSDPRADARLLAAVQASGGEGAALQREGERLVQGSCGLAKPGYLHKTP